MIESIIYASSDIVLMLGAVIVFALYLSGKENPKIYFSLTKIFLLAAMFLSLVFYNKIFAAEYLNENSYTTMIKVVLYLLGMSWFYVSFKWFAGKNLSGGVYCTCGLLLIEVLCIITSSVSLISLYAGVTAFLLIKNVFIKKHLKAEDIQPKNSSFEVVMMFAALAGMMWIYKTTGSFSYEQINIYLSKHEA